MLTQRNLILLNICLIAALIFLLITSFKDEKTVGAGFAAPEQRVRTINLDKNFDFCGEKLPMENWDVRQRLDREMMASVYGHSSTLLAIKRASALFPIIEPILKQEGMPDDLKYLAVAESNLSNAVSPVGARGVWQFMKPTAIQFGLEVNEQVDERYHLEKSTRAACKYLRGQKEKLGSWILAAAAYNAGPDRIATEKVNQRAETFFDMNLVDETMRYVFRIVAIKEVMQHPEEYEFAIEKEHLYPAMTNFMTVEVSEPVENWGDFAKKHGTNYRMLKVYNPWLQDNKLTNKAGKTYQVQIPKK